MVPEIFQTFLKKEKEREIKRKKEKENPIAAPPNGCNYESKPSKYKQKISLKSVQPFNRSLQ